jgi:uncharacterized membrane protein
MNSNPQDLAKRFLRREWNTLASNEQRVIQHVLDRMSISRNLGETAEATKLGDRIADKMASFGGSWTFIISFGVFLAIWAILNTVILRGHKAFDPYPFIFLNLFLSMLAAIQAPVIMMSQNRETARDRERAEHDYEVNLKAELEIRSLHEKMDELREQAWANLVRQQEEQIEYLHKLLELKSPNESDKAR